MPNISYGRLVVPVSADTGQLSRQVAGEAVKAGDQAGRTLSQRIGASLGKGTGAIGRGIATGLGTATLAASGFGVAAFKTAARVGEMDASLRALAKANGLSYSSMQQQVTAIRKQGIEAGTAQSVVAEFAKGHLDLAKSTDLARVAQDSAVISGRNSTEVLNELIHGIVTQQTDVLRTAGINIDASQAQDQYAKSIGKTVPQLTASEKQTAILNAVLTQGKTVAGAYSSAMEEPGKVLRSFPRIINDVQVSVGQGLVKAFGPAILSGYKLAKAIDAAVAPGGALAPIFDSIGAAAAKMVAPLTGVIDLTTKWIESLKPGRHDSMTAAIQRFAPEIAAAAAALGTFAGGKWLTNVPILGEMLGGLGGPVGVAVAGLTTLALTSPEARKALGQLASTLATSLAPVMAQLAPVVALLGEALAKILAAGIKALIPLVPPLVVVLQAVLTVIMPLLPLITDLANIIAYMAPVLVPLAAAWWAITAAQTAYNAVLLATTTRMEILRGLAIGTRIQLALLAVQERVTAAAQWILNAAMAANPIGLVVLALAALAAGLYLAWTRSATFRKIIIGTWDAIRGAFNAAVGWISATFNTIRNAIVGPFTVWWAANGQQVKDIWNALWTAVRAIFVPIWAGIQAVARLGWVVIQGYFNVYSAVIKAVWSVTWTVIQAVVKVAWAVITAVVRAGWAVLTAVFNVGTAAIKAVWSVAWSVMTNVLKVALAAIKASIKIAFDILVGIVTVAVNLLTGRWGKAWEAILNTGRQVWSALSGVFRQIADSASAMTSAVTGAVGRMAGAVASSFRNLLGTVGQIWGQITGTVSRAWSDMISGAWNAGANLIGGLKDGIVNAVSGIGSWIKSIVVDPIIGAVKGFFGIGSPSTVFLGIGLNLIKSLIGGMMPGNVASLVNKVFGGFPQALAALIKRGFVAITQLPKKALGAVKGLLGGTLGAVKGVFDKLLGGVKFARGGVLHEPVTGVGRRTGQLYQFAERGPEMISPLSRAPTVAGIGAAAARTVINVFPQAGQDERQIAAMVSRELAWAGAGGAR